MIKKRRRTHSKEAPEDWIRLGHWAQLTPTLLWAHRGDIPSWAINFQLDGLRQPLDAWYLEAGTLTLQYEREREIHEAPCWVFPQHLPLRQSFSPGSKQMGIRFNLDWPDDSPLLALERTVTFKRGRYRSLERAAAELVDLAELCLEGPHVYAEERTATILGMADLLAKLWAWIGVYISVLKDQGIPLSPRTTFDTRVVAALDYLRQMPLDQTLREKDLAAHCSLSVAQLNRLFQQQLGMSAVRIRNNQRMSAACRALLYSQATIKELAYDLGFNSPQHFAFWFRKRTGTGPREFRRTH